MSRFQPVAIVSPDWQLLSGDLNRSMQHLVSNYREGDVENVAWAHSFPNANSLVETRLSSRPNINNQILVARVCFALFLPYLSAFA